MKIYTKTGDDGDTSLIGGRRVPKQHARIEAYGTIDELISFMGMIRSYDLPEEDNRKVLLIQDKLMIGSALIAAQDEQVVEGLPALTTKDIRWLETEIDNMEKDLPELHNFILPGGHPVISACHIARTVCRRAERAILKVMEDETVPGIIIQYMNRLSDYLFVLGRKVSVYFNKEEIYWKVSL